MWGLLERDLAHPALAPVRAWFDANVPAASRAAAWTEGDRGMSRYRKPLALRPDPAATVPATAMVMAAGSASACGR